MAKQIYRGLSVDGTQFQDDGSGNLQAKTNAANALAALDGSGKLPTSLLPGLAISDVTVVADIAARDALTPEEGDIAKVTDSGDGSALDYIYDGAAWQEIVASPGPEKRTKIEVFTLVAGDITAKEVTLSETPEGDVAAVSIKGVGDQFQTDDYTVSGTTLEWDGIGMDGLVQAGDKVRVTYEYTD